MSTPHARATRHRARDVTTATRGNRPRGPACAERLSVTPARRGPRARAAGRPAGRKAKHHNTPTGHVDRGGSGVRREPERGGAKVGGISAERARGLLAVYRHGHTHTRAGATRTDTGKDGGPSPH